MGQAGRDGPAGLQGGRSARLRGECAAVRVLLGGSPASPANSQAQRHAIRSPHDPNLAMATAACFDSLTGMPASCTRPGPSRFAQCVRPPHPAAAHDCRFVGLGRIIHILYACQTAVKCLRSPAVGWLQVCVFCTTSRPLRRSLFARLRPPPRAVLPTSLWGTR